MKLFVWENCLHGSFGSGEIIAFAETIEQAREEALKSWENDEVFRIVTKNTPKIFTTAKAFCIRGSD